jgi:hypothetical protein
MATQLAEIARAPKTSFHEEHESEKKATWSKRENRWIQFINIPCLRDQEDGVSASQATDSWGDSLLLGGSAPIPAQLWPFRSLALPTVHSLRCCHRVFQGFLTGLLCYPTFFRDHCNCHSQALGPQPGLSPTLALFS